MLRVQDVMTKDVATLAPDMSIRDAMELFSHRHISGAPVVSGREVVGVISSTDLIGFATMLPPVARQQQVDRTDESLLDDDNAEKFDQDGELPMSAYFNELWDDAGDAVVERMTDATGAEWDALSEHTVSEAMTNHFYSLPPTATVREAAEMMSRFNVHRILVINGDKLVGVISASDVARAAAEDRLTKRSFVFNAGSRFDGLSWP